MMYDIHGAPFKFTGCLKKKKIRPMVKWPLRGLRRKIPLKYDICMRIN